MEFYFPTYADLEARRRITAVVRNPAFTASDTDIAQLLTLTRQVASKRDERSQLKATVHACLEADMLWCFLTADEDRKQTLSSPGRLSAHALPLGGAPSDVRRTVVSRIYDIRCRIVHTKELGGGVDLLLPYSEEAAELEHDIALMRYIAQRVLIANGTDLPL